MKKLVVLLLSTFLGSVIGVDAQSFFTNTPQYLVPGFRGSTKSEFSHWDVFYSSYQGPGYLDGFNYPDISAPYGVGSFSSDAGVTPPANSSPSDPYAFWNAANPTIAQILEPGAFIIGPGTTGNIYSYSGPTGYTLSDSTPFSLGTVNLQWQTDGTLIDFSTLKLNYVSNNTAYSISPTNFIAEYQASGSSFGFSVRNRSSAQWNLTGLNITSYSITWRAAGSSDSFQEALLDTASVYSEVTPSTRAWSAGGADTNWSTAANWTGSALPSTRGNVTFNAASNVVLDSSREVSQLTLNAAGPFSLSASNGASLKIDSGIAASPTTPSIYNISAPIVIGSFNLMQIAPNADVTLGGQISGVGGFYKNGTGTLRLTGNNTFSGQMVIDGGTTYVSGTNSYTGVPSIFSGSLILQGNAPSGAAGTLGNATTSVAFGSGGTTGDAATVIIDGPFTVARGFTVSAGADPKTLGGQNTGAGAAFTGAIVLNSAASNVYLTAPNAGDSVTFSGTISGGASGLTLTKSGNGTVIFSGATKSYSNDTFVSAGTLQIASNTIFSGSGGMTVSSGATLLVQGSLSGSGTLTINGGTLGGTGTINRSITLDSGDVLSPGSGIGTLNTVGENWASGGRLRFEIGNTTAGFGTGWDFVNLKGTLALNASRASPFTLEIDSLGAGNTTGLISNFDPNTNYTWKFATASSGITGFDPSEFQFNTAAFSNQLAGSFSVSQNGNDLFLNYRAVPEPSVGALGSVGLIGLAICRRKRAIPKKCLSQRPGWWWVRADRLNERHNRQTEDRKKRNDAEKLLAPPMNLVAFSAGKCFNSAAGLRVSALRRRDMSHPFPLVFFSFHR